MKEKRKVYAMDEFQEGFGASTNDYLVLRFDRGRVDPALAKLK
jgi:hypothetical protein